MAMRVLIVEDEVFIALDLESHLEMMGHEVLGIAANKNTCLAQAEASRPDLALVDLHLAGPSSGIEAAAELRRDHGIACILVSGSLHELSPGDIERIEPLAMLAKPFSMTALTDALETADRILARRCGG
ncbi:response regulator [Profundibacterium mesophilum]|uniref:Two component response regulator n=1 Tax=Profundibacterium mesophilum KAUST100406-0324 TaxID=1037889 RepID=A0A921NTA2_9RHOB|nr:response regulator [Profundibacterium mesophilum]KAF0675108.1 Two component response regulator [Profundibacterium mesophilum KAUST100406-0324]